MEHIKTLNTKNLQNTVKKGGCGECQTSELREQISRFRTFSKQRSEIRCLFL